MKPTVGYSTKCSGRVVHHVCRALPRAEANSLAHPIMRRHRILRRHSILRRHPVLRRATLYILCRHFNPRRHPILCAATLSCAATLRRHPCMNPAPPHPHLRCSCQPPPAPPAQDRYSLDLMSHDKKRHNSKCHPASCLRLLEYLALFCVLKSVGAAPFPSSPAASVADGNGSSPLQSHVQSSAAPMPVPATTHQPQLNFLIAGVQKGGTTALGEHLRKCSPFVCLTPGEDHRYDSIQRLGDVFQLGNVQGCNVTSPLSRFGAEDPLFSYVSEGSLLDRVSSFAPALKIILLLREPVQRAFSQYRMEVARDPKRCCDFFAAMREEARGPPAKKPSRKDIVWRGFYDAQVERLVSHYGQRNVHVAISERVFLSKSQRDSVYNRILEFIGVPVVSNFDAAVFTRPGSNIVQNKTIMLTHDAALFLRRLYVNDTNRVYIRLGYKVTEWDAWYCSSGLNVC